MFRAVVLLALLIGLGSHVAAGTLPRTVTAVRVATPPAIDGVLSESCWRSAIPVSDFTQFDPAEGAAPTESTVVYVLYDDHAIYVGARCLDRDPQGSVSQLTRRDRASEADAFAVMFDSYHDHQTGFFFSTNVSGVQNDGVLSQDGTVYDITWDAVWRSAAVRTTRGWSVEFAIPYNALRFAAAKDSAMVWGVNFRRYISRKRETIEWVMVPHNERLQISRWGHLAGLRDIKPPLHLEVLPYTSSAAEYRSAELTNGPTKSHRVHGGVDVKYGVSRDFTVDATLFPDFGQVEIDQAVMNLTVFEPYFPEKRPFFIEGAQMFAFGTSVDVIDMPLFFSRRIGRRPGGSYSITAPPGGSVERNPTTTTILGAAKVTGQSSSGLSVGALTAVTSREEASIADAAGHLTSVQTEPQGGYGVIRLKQALGTTSWVGVMGTATGREGTQPGLTGGVDWNIRFADGSMTLDGYLAGAAASSGERRNGTAGRVLVSKIEADHFFYVASVDYATRSFNVNDLGYFARPRDFGGYTDLFYRETFASAPLLRYGLGFEYQTRWNWRRVHTVSAFEANGYVDFTNFWRVTTALRLTPPTYEDEQQGIIGVRRRPWAHGMDVSVRTDDRNRVWGTITGTYETNAAGKRSFLGTLALTLRPSSWMEITPTIAFLRTRHDIAWVYPYGNVLDPAIEADPFSVFGKRDVDEVDFGVRGIVTFTRTLSVQWFLQFLLDRGRYRDYARTNASGELVPYDFVNSTAFVSGEFNEATLNGNLLLRWEYLPGSTFYLAWTQERYGDAGLYDRPLETTFRRSFALPMQNVILAKLTYWFSL